MGQSLRAVVRRGLPLSDEERTAVWSILGEFDVVDEIESYVPGGGGLNWESFHWSEPGDGVVFEGSSRLPDVTVSAMFKGIDHWGRMLGRLRSELFVDAEWSVDVEGDPIEWLVSEGRFWNRSFDSVDLESLDDLI